MQQQNQQIADVLTQRGWKVLPGPAFASKTFATAVGPKDAVLWLTRRVDQVGNRSLSGEYQSEGRNILGGCLQIVHEAADASAVNATTARFVDAVEAEIADSYAVRLLR